jgi:hypothetical protein
MVVRPAAVVYDFTVLTIPDGEGSTCACLSLVAAP